MSNPHLPRVRRILDKLSQVRAEGISCFGDRHQFRLEPPLSEAQIRDFEVKHGIDLPADFRVFVQYGGGSGAGPYYGLYPLARWDDFAANTGGALAKDSLRRPCLFVPGTNDHPPLASDASERLFEGALCLGTQGCCYHMLLIVSGPCRGRVLYVDEDCCLHPYVVRDLDFLAWYERWLDELLAGYQDSGWSFGYGPAGDEVQLLGIIADPSSDDDLAGEAACNLSKLPRLSETGRTRLLDLLAHPVAEVRQGAVSAIEKHQVHAAIALLTQRLGDPNLYVASALMSLAPDASAEAVKRSLREATAEHRACATYYALSRAGKLTREDLLDILHSSSSLEPLRNGAVGDLLWTPADHELAARLLADPSRNVRLSAALGLLRVDIPALAGVLIQRLQEEHDATIIDHLLTLLGRLAYPAAADVFAQWVTSGDDFHRLHALEGLLRLDEERARKLAAAMLGEYRLPLRMPARQSHLDTIAILTSRILRTGTWHDRPPGR